MYSGYLRMSRCFLLLLAVSCVVSSPVSQPVYQTNPYLSAQQIPAVQYKPQAQGYITYQPQYISAPPNRSPIYETSEKEGLQNYASVPQRQAQPQQQIQQILLASNVDRQIQRVAQNSGQVYLQQVQTAQQQAQAQEAISAAQRKLTSTTLGRQPLPLPVPQQPPQNTQYLREQPVQQQVRYVQRPAQVPVQYRQVQPQLQQQQLQQREKELPEDYDPNPSYQFGFDVKDDLYTNYQNRKEQREGNKITGSYSVVDSDGFVRTVTYTADPKEGFKAEVTRQPTDIVVKIPKPEPQYQKPQQQYIQAVPERNIQYQPQLQVQARSQPQKPNVIYQYQ